MKVYHREPTLLEQMNAAIDQAAQSGNPPIDYFELSSDEFSKNFSSFDRQQEHRTNAMSYSYKGIPIKVLNEQNQSQ